MNSDDQKKFSKLVCGLFPCRVTDEQAKLLREQAANLPFDVAEKFAKQYRAGNPDIEISDFLTGLQAVAMQEERSKSLAGREKNWIELQRDRWSGRLDNASNLEVILRVKRADWDNPKCSRSDGNRDMIRREAASLIVRFCGFAPTEAERLAEYIFNEDFQGVLNQIRKLQPASSCA